MRNQGRSGHFNTNCILITGTLAMECRWDWMLNTVQKSVAQSSGLGLRVYKFSRSRDFCNASACKGAYY